MISLKENVVPYVDTQQVKDSIQGNTIKRQTVEEQVFQNLFDVYGIEKGDIVEALGMGIQDYYVNGEQLYIIPTQLPLPTYDDLIRRSYIKQLGGNVGHLSYMSDTFYKNEEKISYVHPTVGKQSFLLLDKIPSCPMPLSHMQVKEKVAIELMQVLSSEHEYDGVDTLKDLNNCITHTYQLEQIGDWGVIFKEIIRKVLSRQQKVYPPLKEIVQDKNKYTLKKWLFDPVIGKYTYCDKQGIVHIDKTKTVDDMLENIENIRFDAEMYYKTIYPICTNKIQPDIPQIIPVEWGMEHFDKKSDELVIPFNMINLPTTYFAHIVPKEDLKFKMNGKEQIDTVWLQSMILIDLPSRKKYKDLSLEELLEVFSF